MQETQETQVQSLGWVDLLEELMATHSSILMDRGTWRTIGGQSWTRLKRLCTIPQHVANSTMELRKFQMEAKE